ncbi:MAG: ribosome assembly RNA-binding protein YhbY [Deltaproteobacteria bacterium]|nr:ribosome assembly RNA-binding protein YhbY [Deltaproteobacteria bacterium]
MAAPTISSRARSHLRSLAHGLKPVVQIGAEGVSEAVTEAVGVALAEHELIKVKLGQGFNGERKPAARELAEAVEADLTQVIGRVIVLYRPRPEKDPRNKDKRITVPD